MDTEQLQDWINIGMAGNSIAMDWYAMTHDQPLPSVQRQSVLQRTLGGDLSGMARPMMGNLGQVSVGPSSGMSILLIGAVGLGLFLLLR